MEERVVHVFSANDLMKKDFFGSMSGKNPSNNLLDRIKKEHDKEDVERKKSQTEKWYDLQFVITCI